MTVCGVARPSERLSDGSNEGPFLAELRRTMPSRRSGEPATSGRRISPHSRPSITRTFYGGFQGTTAVRAIASVATSSASASVISWARLLADRFGGGGNPFANF